MVLKCNNCGKNLHNSKGFCSYCGTKINDFNQIFLCPVCNNQIDYASEFCGECGFKITKDLNYVIKESNSKSCPYCANKNNIDAEFCGNCGKTLPLVSNLELIQCPDCKSLVREDVNYCRFCGHSFITNKKSIFAKKINSHIRYCQNCGNKIPNVYVSQFCDNCGTVIPDNIKTRNDGYTGVISHEDQQLRFVNNFIVPLSKEYNTNFRKVTLSQYFNISYEQELHIIYLIMKQIKKDYDENIILVFKDILEETKESYKDIERAILNRVKERMVKSFDNNGLTISEVRTITGDSYETVETPYIKNKHGTGTKVLATAFAGPLGFVATSGVKQTTATKQVLNKGSYQHTSVNISKKYIVIKSYIDDSGANIFNSSKGNVNKTVVYWEDVKLIDYENYIVLNNGGTFRIPEFDPNTRINTAFEQIVGTSNLKTFQEYKDLYYENVYQEVIKILPNLIENAIKNNKKEANNSNRGMQNDHDGTDMIECNECGKLNDINNKFCGECGFKLEIVNYCPNCDKIYTTGEKFCTECGTKLTLKK